MRTGADAIKAGGATRFLDGRHAIVTGGGRGIGAAIAAALAGAGARLTLLGRTLDVLESQAAQLQVRHGVEVSALTCDVSVGDDVARAFVAARERLGPAFILVNNAGQAEGSPFLDTTLEAWQRMLDVNLTSAFLCTRQVLGDMLEQRAGRIINIASTSGLKGYRNVAAYCASKHGLVGLTRALAAETVRRGITVNAVCPAYTDTEMAERAVHTVVRDMQRTEDDARAIIARSNPLGRLIEPREVASAVLWLCSPDATAMTGQAITVAGGEIM